MIGHNILRNEASAKGGSRTPGLNIHAEFTRRASGLICENHLTYHIILT